ncbi:GGDEF domain-containing protein [Actinoplanes sp. CA-030573]|uniref:GGDEF domain-containing protein n=1 Tax=Actinoplanes sp. CA-030573 TaxID=3239898 RepID=UPI003D8E6892
MAIYFCLPMLGVGDDGQTFYYFAVSAAATGAVAAGARRASPSQRAPWLLLAAGQLSYTAGDLAYYVAHTVYHSDIFPAPADAFYLLQYPLICWSLVLLVRRRTPSWNASTLLDAAILAIALGMLWWIYLIEPLAAGNDGSESFLSTLVSVAYPMMDLIVLVVAVRLAVGAGASSVAFRLLLASVVAMLVGDMVYGLQTASDTYRDGGIPDLLWLCEYVLLGAAALHPTMRTLDQRAKVALPPVSSRRLLVLSSAALLPLALLYLDYTDEHRTTAFAIFICGVILFALIITKMRILLRLQGDVTLVDALTGFKARGVLLSHLNLECERAKSWRQDLGIALVEIDQHKLLVQIYGQPAGDEVLIEISRRLASLCGSAAILGKMDETTFAAVFPGYDRRRLAYAGGRIQEAVQAEKFAINDHDAVRVTVSIGMASLFHDAGEPGTLLQGAEQALHRAVRAGRNRVCTPQSQVEYAHTAQ